MESEKSGDLPLLGGIYSPSYSIRGYYLSIPCTHHAFDCIDRLRVIIVIPPRYALCLPRNCGHVREVAFGEKEKDVEGEKDEQGVQNNTK